jgi:integrase
LFIYLAATMGLRRGEILGLRWEDFNIDEGQVIINRTLKQERRFAENGKANVALVTDKTKTLESERTLKIGLGVTASLMRQRARVDLLRFEAGEKWNEQGWVFPSTLGTAQNPNNVYKRYVRFCQAHELRHIRVHDLRHTAAVIGLEAGIRLEAVSQALGHTRIEVTKSTYAPYVQVLADEFTEGVDDYLNEVLLMKQMQTEHELDEGGSQKF